MPHQCTTCGHAFDDGSKEMLSGCPDCGGNTFQFHPEGTTVPESPPDAEPPEPEGSTAANTVGRAATKVRDLVSSGDGTDPGPDSTADRPESPAATGPTSRDDPTAGDPTVTTANDSVAGDPAAGDPNATTATGTPDTADMTSGSADAMPGPADTTPDSADTASSPDPNAAWPSERGAGSSEGEADLDPDDDGIIDADAREAARAVDAAETDRAASTGSPASAAAPTETEGAPGATQPDAATNDATTNPEPVPGGAAADSGGPSDGRVVSTPDEDQPDISELRQQLNDQFESIKILEPGQYELNLMELYDREEYIIALQENGRYVIQVPEQWLGDQPGDI
jgi:predicted  nucleic acid-binding Zn-ribbon protein